jgi:hypothetical protein
MSRGADDLLLRSLTDDSAMVRGNSVDVVVAVVEAVLLALAVDQTRLPRVTWTNHNKTKKGTPSFRARPCAYACYATVRINRRNRAFSSFKS